MYISLFKENGKINFPVEKDNVSKGLKLYSIIEFSFLFPRIEM